MDIRSSFYERVMCKLYRIDPSNHRNDIDNNSDPLIQYMTILIDGSISPVIYEVGIHGIKMKTKIH